MLRIEKTACYTSCTHCTRSMNTCIAVHRSKVIEQGLKRLKLYFFQSVHPWHSLTRLVKRTNIYTYNIYIQTYKNVKNLKNIKNISQISIFEAPSFVSNHHVSWISVDVYLLARQCSGTQIWRSERPENMNLTPWGGEGLTAPPPEPPPELFGLFKVATRLSTVPN